MSPKTIKVVDASGKERTIQLTEAEGNVDRWLRRFGADSMLAGRILALLYSTGEVSLVFMCDYRLVLATRESSVIGFPACTIVLHFSTTATSS